MHYRAQMLGISATALDHRQGFYAAQISAVSDKISAVRAEQCQRARHHTGHLFGDLGVDIQICTVFTFFCAIGCQALFS